MLTVSFSRCSWNKNALAPTCVSYNSVNKSRAHHCIQLGEWYSVLPTHHPIVYWPTRRLQRIYGSVIDGLLNTERRLSNSKIQLTTNANVTIRSLGSSIHNKTKEQVAAQSWGRRLAYRVFVRRKCQSRRLWEWCTWRREKEGRCRYQIKQCKYELVAHSTAPWESFTFLGERILQYHEIGRIST